MGALSSVLAIPYRSIKESIERRNKNKKKASSAKGSKSAPGSRLPSRNPSLRESTTSKQKAQSLSGEPASGAAQAEPSETQGPEQSAVQGEANVAKNIALEAPVPVSVAAAFLPILDSSLGKCRQRNSLAESRTLFSTSASTANAASKKSTDKMATDEDYMAFLDKANEDPSAGTSKASAKSKKHEFKTTDDDVDVPSVLVKATKDAWYPSEADIEIMDIGEWDPQGQYKDVVKAVRDASKGSDVRVYRVPGEGSRVEYWVVGVEGGRLVGCKALAVES
ncbi:ribosomal L3 protein [Rutstroemia sp. NJR-2017a BBW]|nr:ribosomal L3 protein [Rutstroemia sp. NJR-2017a BBW]